MFRKLGGIFFILLMFGAVTAGADEITAVRVDGVITRAGGPLVLGESFHGLLRYDAAAPPQAAALRAFTINDPDAELRLVCGDIVLESVGGLTLTVTGEATVSSLSVTAGGGWDITAGARVTHAEMTIGFIPGLESRDEPMLPDATSFDRFWSDGSSITFHLSDGAAPAVGDIHAVSVLTMPVVSAVTMSLLTSAAFALMMRRRRRG